MSDAARNEVTLALVATLAVVTALAVAVTGSVVAPGEAVPGVAAANESATATPIDACTVVTEPGRYVLTSDVRNAEVETCIEIRADDVTLDGAGHAIDGGRLGQATVGISVGPGSANVSVRNLTVSRWASGVRYEGATGGEISGVRARFDAEGIHIADSRGVVVQSAIAEHDFVGVAVERSERVRVENATIRGDAAEASVRSPRGFDAGRATDVSLTRTRDTRVRNLTATGNWSVSVGSRSVNTSVSVLADAGTLSLSGSGVVVSSAATPPLPSNRSVLGEAVRAEATAPNATLSLGLRYDDADLADADLAEFTLGLWRSDGRVWTPLESRTDTDRNLVRASVTDFSTFAVLGRGTAPDTAEGSLNATSPGPVSVTRQAGVEIEFTCEDVRVSLPPDRQYSLVVHYFVPETGEYDRALLGPLEGTVEEPFDDDLVFFEVNVRVGRTILASGYLPEACPNSPGFAFGGADGDKP